MSNLTEAIAAAERLFPSLESIPAYLRTADINAAIVVSRALVSVAYDPLQLVKPLEFDDEGEAKTVFGAYYVRKHTLFTHWWWYRGGGDLNKCDSLEAGKAACEADYRERLRGIFLK